MNHSSGIKGNAQFSPLYHLYTIWLFTRSDIKTIIAPSTVFALIGLLSRGTLTTTIQPDIRATLQRLPSIVFWIWINLLPFSIENQKQPESIEEDCENKSWRPLPAGRLTPLQATSLMTVSYLMAMVSSLVLGGGVQALFLVVLGYWYNNLGGGDRNCLVRNLINALGYSCFLSGALQVGVSHSHAGLNTKAYQWLSILALIIFTTIHAQDIHDQGGDSIRNRKTVPLVFGDWQARWLLAVMIGIWSWICPVFWEADRVGLVVPAILGLVTVARYLGVRTVKDDKKTYRIYNLWIVSLFVLPLLSRTSGSSRYL
ncbi:UbiA prenyltransferase family-domain-containing protein [Halenospora varia]|nr:UbiA prenyltransferase family-domain-containing protein [Halenospora varia]